MEKMSIIDKINEQLNKFNDSEGVYSEFEGNIDEDLYYRMIEFLTNLEGADLPEELEDEYYEILDDLNDFPDEEDWQETDNLPEEPEELEDEMYTEEELNELRPRVNRLKRSERRVRSRQYRRNKAAIKRKTNRYRKSAKGRQMAKKRKRMAKMGKTATGKLMTTRRYS